MCLKRAKVGVASIAEEIPSIGLEILLIRLDVTRIGWVCCQISINLENKATDEIVNITIIAILLELCVKHAILDGVEDLKWS